MSTGHALHTGTVTMLFTDIEGSTGLLKQLGNRYGDLLSDHRRLLREAVATHGGREMDTQGDAFFVTFTRARNAVDAAVEAQRILAANEWPDGVECRVRMGLHTGEPSVGDEGYHGIGLHRGARIAAAAHGGQILLSNTTAELIQDDLPVGVTLRDLGEQRLKDIDRPERIYQVVAEGLTAEFPPLRIGSPPTAESSTSRRPRIALLAGALVAGVAAAATGVVLLTGGGSNLAAAAGEISANSVGVLGSRSGRLAGQIPVGASPSAMAAGLGSLWVTNVDAHSVSRVDPLKGVTVQTIQVGNGPAGVAVGGGFVWVTNGLDGTVSKIDANANGGGGGVVDTIPVGNGPAGIAADAHDVWVANSSDGTVTQIDVRTDKPRKVIPVGQSADGIAVSSGSVWVTSQSAGTVTRIDARTGSVGQPVDTGSGADAVAAGPHAVWVANYLAGTIARIDPASNTVRATIPVGDGPNGIAITPEAVWVSNELAGTLSKIDPASNLPALPVKTGNRPEGVAVVSGQLFVAVRASGSGRSGGALTVLIKQGSITTVDPAIAYTPDEWQVLVLTNDGLTGFRRTGGNVGTRVVPDLAVSLPAPSDGGRSYSFQLRPGIRYSTGGLVQPEDFRRALERSLVQGFTGPYYAGIVGARRCLAAPKRRCDLSKGIVTDSVSKTVTFHLTAPDPDFLYKLSLPAAYAVPANTPDHALGPVPATGPYEIASFNEKRGIKLVRNPRFREWSPAAQPSGFPAVIVERAGGSEDQHVKAVLSGSADLASDSGSPSPTVLASVRTRHASQLEVSPTDFTQFLVLNTRIAPFDDRRARQALNFALDREHLRDLALGTGLGQVTCQVLPPDFSGYRRYCPYTADPNESGLWTAADLERARQLVRASGTAGQAVTFWIPEWIHIDEAAGRYVVSTLDAIGYRARLRVAADPYADEDKIHLQVGFYAWGPDFVTPSGFFVPTLTCDSYNTFNPDNLNGAEFCDPAIDREIARAQSLQTSDPETASRLWTRVDRDVVDQAPWVPYANPVVLEVVSTRVGNYQYNPQWGTLLDQLWVR